MIRHRSSSTPIVRPGFSRERAASLAVAEEFTPSSIPNLLFWYDGGQLWDSGVSDEDVITEWEDNSGTSPPLVRDIPTNSRPTMEGSETNGPPYNAAVEFDSDASMNWGGLLTHSASDYTFFFGGGTTSASGTRKLLDVQTGRLILYLAVGGKVGFYDGADQTWGTAGTSLNILVWALGASSGADVYRWPTLLGSGTYTAKAIGGTVNVGAHYDNTQHFIGPTAYMNVFIGYDRKLSESEIGQVADYISDRYTGL